MSKRDKAIDMLIILTDADESMIADLDDSQLYEWLDVLCYSWDTWLCEWIKED